MDELVVAAAGVAVVAVVAAEQAPLQPVAAEEVELAAAYLQVACRHPVAVAEASFAVQEQVDACLAAVAADAAFVLINQ